MPWTWVSGKRMPFVARYVCATLSVSKNGTARNPNGVEYGMRISCSPSNTMTTGRWSRLAMQHDKILPSAMMKIGRETERWKYAATGVESQIRRTLTSIGINEATLRNLRQQATLTKINRWNTVNTHEQVGDCTVHSTRCRPRMCVCSIDCPHP